ncbi:MAG: hypothetical protein GY804_12550 [Alphaproteobacteria bacterium]|nr:hypothetical protein [Alphaproteobacteria bacterium]
MNKETDLNSSEGTSSQDMNIILACKETAERLKESLSVPEAGIRLTRYKKLPAPKFTDIWDNKIQPKFDKDEMPSIEALNGLYDEAIKLIHHSILGIDDTERPEIKERKMSATIKALEEMNTEDTSKIAFLSHALADTAKLGLAISNINPEDPPNEAHQAHIDDIKQLNQQLFDRFRDEPRSVILHSSALYRTSPPEIQRSINEDVIGRQNAHISTDKNKRLDSYLKDNPVLHKETKDTISPFLHNMTSEERDSTGTFTGVGIISGNQITTGVPVDLLNLITETIKIKDEFGLKGQSTILVASPHEELIQELGTKNINERVQETKRIIQNFVDALGRDDFEVITREELEAEAEYKSIDLSQLDEETQERIHSHIGDNQDIAYYNNETEHVLHSKTTKGQPLKVGWTGNGHDERNFDNVFTIFAETLGDKSMSFAYITPHKTFEGTNTSPYSVKPEDASKCMLIEDFEDKPTRDSQTIIAASGDNSSIADAYFKKFGHFGAKLAKLMLDSGKTNDGRNAINRLLSTIRNVAEISSDQYLTFNDNIEEITGNKKNGQDYDFANVCSFICDKMTYINNKFLSSRENENTNPNGLESGIASSSLTNLRGYFSNVNGALDTPAFIQSKLLMTLHHAH